MSVLRRKHAGKIMNAQTEIAKFDRFNNDTVYRDLSEHTRRKRETERTI